MSKSILDPWEVSEFNFPATADISEQIKFLINYAVLAPSVHNTQPWIFNIVDGMAEVYADRTRALPISDPEDRELLISCGAAIFNLRIAIRHFGYAYSIELFPNPGDHDFLARVRIVGPEKVSKEEHLLFEAVTRRRTNRMPFEKLRMPDKLTTELRSAAAAEGAWFHIVQSDETRNAIADLIEEGDRVQGENKQFRRELASWVHHNRSRSRDGMPGYAFGIGDLASYAGPTLIRTFDWGKGQAAKHRQLAEGSPLLAVLGTDEDDARSWLCAGQALSRMLLRARYEGIYASYMNQPVELPELRPRLRDIIGRTGFPQMLMRMGYGPRVIPTPRRTVDEVLL